MGGTQGNSRGEWADPIGITPQPVSLPCTTFLEEDHEYSWDATRHKLLVSAMQRFLSLNISLSYLAGYRLALVRLCLLPDNINEDIHNLK